MGSEQILDRILKAMEDRDLDMVAFAWSDPRILREDEVRDVLSAALREQNDE